MPTISFSPEATKLSIDGRFPHHVSAVKAIRTITNWGLKEAKDAYDKIKDSNRSINIPDNTTNETLYRNTVRDLRMFGLVVTENETNRNRAIGEIKTLATSMLTEGDYSGVDILIAALRALEGRA